MQGTVNRFRTSCRKAHRSAGCGYRKFLLISVSLLRHFTFNVSNIHAKIRRGCHYVIILASLRHQASVCFGNALEKPLLKFLLRAAVNTPLIRSHRSTATLNKLYKTKTKPKTRADQVFSNASRSCYLTAGTMRWNLAAIFPLEQFFLLPNVISSFLSSCT